MQSKSLRVLIIENDIAFSQTVKSVFEQVGDASIITGTASSLEEGFEKLVAEKFDVVILEFFLADGAGLANIPLLKSEAPRVPIIVVGSADDETVAVEAMHAGVQDYLVKDQLTPRWLLRSIRYAVERHEADMALLDAEEKYRDIFDHLTEGIFQTTTDGHYLMANAALARIYGYASPEELMQSLTDIGRKLYVQPGRRDEFVRTMQEHDTLTEFESQIFRKDGSIIWISENCRAVRDAQGHLLYYEGTVEDITLRRQVELDLEASESLYHSLVETMPQNVFRKDLQGRFTFANQQYCRHYHCTLEDILGKTDFDFFPKDLAEKYQKDDLRVMATGQSIEIVEDHHPLGQDRSIVQVVKTPLYDPNGNIIGLQGIFWDITPQKVAEEQIRKANAELASSRELLRLKNIQMEDDLKMASEIQLTMLPQQFPTLPRTAKPEDSAFQFTPRYHPTGTVGGDFFTVYPLSDTEVAVFICDVAGHGVRSALITAMIRALVEELRPYANDPGEFLTRLNSDLSAILRHTGTPVLTTAFYLVANSKTGDMRYANAGHPKPLLIRRRAGVVKPIRHASRQIQPALGLFEQARYQTSAETLAPHDVVMLFTDGLYEVHAPNDNLYTQEMLMAGVQKQLQLPVSQLFDHLLQQILDFAVSHEFVDDVCLVGMEYVGRKSQAV